MQALLYTKAKKVNMKHQKEERQLHFREERPNWKARLKKIEQQRHSISLLLDGVGDVRNIGMLFRLADAAWLKKIYTFGSKPDLNPKKLKRIARSTNRFIPHEHLSEVEAVKALKEGADLIGLEITTASIPYRGLEVNRPIVLVIGSEQRGISEELLALTDQCIHLPMYGINTSMNVAMATSIAVYELVEKCRQKKGSVRNTTL